MDALSPEAPRKPLDSIPIDHSTAVTVDPRLVPRPFAGRWARLRPREHWNPFYVLSAFSMLASCYALNYDFMRGPESLAEIARPLVALQIYEVLVLATAIFLVRTERAPGDARMLALIEAPFLVDVTYFLGEAATFDPRAGTWLGAGAFVLALAKLAAVNAGMGLGWQRGERAHFVLLLGLLHALPPVLMRCIAVGPVHPMVLHAAWWCVAAALSTKPDHVVTRHVDVRTDLGHSVEALFRRVLLVALAGSLVAHLAVLHFVHDVTYFRGNASPILLAFAALLTRERFQNVAPRLRLRSIALLPLVAIALELTPPRGALRPIPALGDLTISPYWLVVAGAAVVYVLAFLRLGTARFGVLAACTAIAAACGQTPRETAHALATRADDAWLAASALVPRTLAEWGAIGLVVAFALLGAGIRASVRTRPEPLARASS